MLTMSIERRHLRRTRPFYRLENSSENCHWALARGVWHVFTHPAVGYHGRRNYCPSWWDPKTMKVLSLKSGIGRNSPLYASPTARNSILRISSFPFHSTLFFPNPLQRIACAVTVSQSFIRDLMAYVSRLTWVCLLLTVISNIKRRVSWSVNGRLFACYFLTFVSTWHDPSRLAWRQVSRTNHSIGARNKLISLISVSSIPHSSAMAESDDVSGRGGILE